MGTLLLSAHFRRRSKGQEETHRVPTVIGHVGTTLGEPVDVVIGAVSLLNLQGRNITDDGWSTKSSTVGSKQAVPIQFKFIKTVRYENNKNIGIRIRSVYV